MADGALIERQREPQNLESPPSIFNAYITPVDLFYVRNHFDMPRVNAEEWRLRIEGAVAQPRELRYADLLDMPRQTVTATLECAGNSRTFLPEKCKGVQWVSGAVGTAEWSGVALADVLARAGLALEAADIILEGDDAGEVDEEPKTPGRIRYARSLPLAKALRPDVLLAIHMNGRPLTPEHGFPVRAIVPGWYGMASVKWLSRIVVSEAPFFGYFQTFEYSRWERGNGEPSLVPLGAGEVKSQIAAPAPGETLPRGVPYRVHGAAWAGESEIARVELSVDAGDTWRDASLLDTPRRYCWSRWDCEWIPERSGPAELMARATDASGRSQPSRHAPDERHYAVHHVLPIGVDVD